MKNQFKFEQFFSRLTPPEPPPDLFNKVMQRLQIEQRLGAIKRRLVLFSAVMLGSTAAFVPVFRLARSGLTESGFIEFFSLLFSDFELIMTHWQSFISALLESLPIMSVVAFLGIILVFIESLRFLTQDIKVVFTSLNSR